VTAEPDSTDEQTDPDEDDLLLDDVEPEAEPELVPYAFDASDVATAVAIVDAAFENTLDGFFAANAIRDAASVHGLDPETPMVRELSLAASYPLQLARAGRVGCELRQAAEEGGWAWPPRIRDVEEQVIHLWRAVASNATAPAAIARFEDLLFCRRDGNGLQRATRAAEAYLEAADRGDIDMDAVEAVVRAWTLARSVRHAESEARVRDRMAHISDDVLTNVPGERPGVVLPLLGALAQGPLSDQEGIPDPIDVDTLLTRAAAAFDRGNIGSEVAGYRRSRTDDPAAAEAINRDEVATYFREAASSTVPAVRMHHLEAAAQTARGRGLPDEVRRATTEMQKIKPSELGLMHIKASGSLPRLVPESWLRQFTRSSDWRAGIEWFLAGSPPSGDIERLRDHERQNRSVFRRLFQSTVLGGDGLPRTTTSGEDDQVAHEMGFAARVGAENIGRMMAEGLRRLADHYGTPGEDELVEVFTRLGCRDIRLARSLAKAYLHFWEGDYESCVHVAAPKFEAAARSLLRELDEGIYRVQAGKDPGGYPGLYVLLDELEKLALDESWAYFFRWLLVVPYGANLRNEVAHGFVFDISATYAALTLRAVSVLVTVAGPPVENSVEPEADIAAPRERDEVLRLLSSPVTPAGRFDRILASFVRQLERTWWAIETRRVRARIRRNSRQGGR